MLLWVLHGARHGDNEVLSAIAGDLGVPFRVVRIRFNRAVKLPIVQFLGTRLSWRSDEPLVAPWPDVVLAAGRNSVAPALWIKRRSKGRTRLVHVNRPRAPLGWFDLIVTTPQFMLPERSNIVTHLLPFLGPQPGEEASVLPERWRERAAELPRPWTAVMVGGNSRPDALDRAAAERLAETVNAEVRGTGGSAWVLASPRTPREAMTIVEQGLQVPAQVVRWGDGDNPYRALRRLADRFIVTGDSASMLAEAVLSGRPVSRFELSYQPDRRWRVASAWRRAAERRPGSLVARLFHAALAAGLVTSVRELGRMQQAYERAGLIGSKERAASLAESERRETIERVRALLPDAG